MVAIGPGEAAVEGRELAVGHMEGNLGVVERIVIIDVADQVDEVESVQHVPSEGRPIGEDAADEQGERRIVQRREPEPAPSHRAQTPSGQHPPATTRYGRPVALHYSVTVAQRSLREVIKSKVIREFHTG